MKRLTTRRTSENEIAELVELSNSKGWIEFSDHRDYEAYQKAINKLASYEDAHERGALLKLPSLYYFPADPETINRDRWQVVYNYRGCILVTNCIYDKATAISKLREEQRRQDEERSVYPDPTPGNTRT